MSSCSLCRKPFLPKHNKRTFSNLIVKRLEGLDFRISDANDINTRKLCRKCFDNIAFLEKAKKIKNNWIIQSTFIKRKRMLLQVIPEGSFSLLKILKNCS